MWAHYKAWYDQFSIGEAILEEGTQHFNQVFITANPVLRSEIRKFFSSLLRGEYGSSEDNNCVDPTKLECGLDKPTLSVSRAKSYPLFLTKREWLVLLDGTLETPFFERKRGTNSELTEESASLAWGRVENNGIFDLSECSFDDSSDDEIGNSDSNFEVVHQNQHGKLSGPLRKIEVDYEYFAAEIWPKLSESRSYSSSLLWCEFTSFIKGSAESMANGFLTEAQYVELGRKRAPNFKGCRNIIYQLFLEYESICRRIGGFDLCDLVYHIINEIRLKNPSQDTWSALNYSGYAGIPLHELYVDEVSISRLSFCISFNYFHFFKWFKYFCVRFKTLWRPKLY